MSAPGNAWRSVHGRITGRPTNFSWVADGLAGSGRPMSRAELDWARGQGVAAVVSMTEDPLPEAWTGGVRYLHLPTPDLTPPSQEDIRRAVEFARARISEGSPVMIHCAAGRGRAGTILACYMVSHGGLQADEAIAELRRKRPGSIEVPEQQDAVRQWARG